MTPNQRMMLSVYRREG